MANFVYSFEKGLYDASGFLEGSVYGGGPLPDSYLSGGPGNLATNGLTLSGDATHSNPKFAMVFHPVLSSAGVKDFFTGTHKLSTAYGAPGTVGNQPVIGVLYDIEKHRTQLSNQANTGLQQSLTSYFLQSPDTSISGRLSGAYAPGDGDGNNKTAITGSISTFENRSALSGYAAVISTAISADFTVAVVGRDGAAVVYDVDVSTGGSLMPWLSTGVVKAPKQQGVSQLSAKGPGTDSFLIGPETRRKALLGYI